MNPPLRLLLAYQQRFSDEPAHLLPVPGREMWLAAHPSGDSNYTLLVPDLDGNTTFDQRSARDLRTTLKRPLPSWSRLCAGVVVLLAERGLQLPGMVVVLAGDEPRGPRYEYALGMGFALLWHTVNGRECDAQCLIQVLERVRRSV